MRPRERQFGPLGLELALLLDRVRDVLAGALLAAAAQADDGGHARELARDRVLEPVECERFDLDVEVGNGVVGRHGCRAA